MGPRTVYARAMDGVWHVATATYPNEMAALCGPRLRADLFSTDPYNDEVNWAGRGLCGACCALPLSNPDQSSPPKAKE